MADSVYLTNPFSGGGGGGTPGGSSGEIQYNDAGSFGGVSGLTWDGTDLTQARTTTVIQTPGAAGSGNESMTLFQMNTPASADNTAPFEMYLGGATFETQWDPVLYFGYNASGADVTEPVMRQVIEGLYSHGTDDFEMYWEYLSTDRLTLERPIFWFKERDSATPGQLVFTGNGFAFNTISAASDLTVSYIANGGSWGTILKESGNRGISAWAGTIGADAGWYAYASPWPNSQYSGALSLRASGDGGGATVNTNAYAIQLITNGKVRQRIGDDGKIGFYYNDAGDFTNYERYAANLTSGLMTLAAESGGTGAANMGFALTPKGSGAITHNGPTTLTGGTVTTSTPLISATQTWNNASNAFVGLSFAFTNTASLASGDQVFNFTVGGSSVLKHELTAANGWTLTSTNAMSANYLNANTGLFAQTLTLGTGAAFSGDVILGREAAAVCQMGADANGAAIAQTFKAHDGITGTDIAGANLTVAGGRGTGAGAPGNLIFSTATALSTGTTAQTLTARMTLAQATLTFADAVDVAFNATTGTKIGTATTQKLAFYNATPIVQGASVADASGGAVIDAEARTAINALISRIEATGLIATV